MKGNWGETSPEYRKKIYEYNQREDKAIASYQSLSPSKRKLEDIRLDDILKNEGKNKLKRSKVAKPTWMK
jgi:hypothetical protein